MTVTGRLVALALATAACGGEPRTDATRDTASPVPAPPVARDTAAGAATWRVTPHGIGPVTAGMPFADAAIAIGASPEIAAADRECGYVRAPGAPVGVSFMVRDGIVARIDVDSSGILTAEGIGIGDSEDRVRSAYAARVVERPHKYTAGKYLIVGGDSTAAGGNRLVFETDGQVVTAFQAGRLPEVEWVEGCS